LAIAPFGCIYRPLYEIVQYDIGLARCINLIIIIGLAALCINCLLVNLGKNKTKGLVFKNVLPLSCGVFISLFAPFLEMRFTPSYNTLALQGILVTIIGVFLAKKSSWLPLFLIAVGGVLTFLGKPTSAAFLASVILAYLIINRSISLQQLGMLLLLALLVMGAAIFMVEGSLTRFVQKYIALAEISQKISPMYDFWNVVRVSKPPIKLRQILICFLFMAILVWLAKRSLDQKSKEVTLVSVGITLLVFLVILGLIRLPPIWIDEIGLQILAFPLAAAALFRFQTGKNPMTMLHLPLVILLLLLPYVYVFGTGRAYWDNMPGASFFWFLAGVPFLSACLSYDQIGKVLVPWTLMALLAGACIVSIAEKNPYRQNIPLSEMKVKFKPTGALFGIMVEEERAKFFAELQIKATRAGLSPGTNLIDLTGSFPGTALVLDLVPMGSPWLSGGYEGSNEVASLLLERVDRGKLHNAWVLLAPDSPRSLDPKILSRLGLRFPQDYVEVFSVVLPEGRNFPTQPIRQIFYKPANPFSLYN
jgi:hypothetical protein